MKMSRRSRVSDTLEVMRQKANQAAVLHGKKIREVEMAFEAFRAADNELKSAIIATARCKSGAELLKLEHDFGMHVPDFFREKKP